MSAAGVRSVQHNYQDMMKTPQTLKLQLVKTRFVARPEDAEQPPEQVTMTVSRELFDNAVAFAGRRGFRVPGRKLHCRNLPAGHVADLLRRIREGLKEKSETAVLSARRRHPDHLDAYFAQHAHERSLLKLTAFLAGGGELNVEG